MALASARVTRVRSGSSVTGSSRTATPRRSPSAAVTELSGLAGVQPAGAEQVRGQVAIAEAEPVLAADPGQLVHDRPALAGHAPSGLPVVHAGQGVGDRVEVGADVQAVQDHVVADVDDGRDVGRRHDAHEPREHPGGPDAAAQGHQHAASIGAPGRRARPSAPGTIAARHASAHPLGSARRPWCRVLREAARVNGDVEAYVEPAGRRRAPLPDLRRMGPRRRRCGG